LKDIERYDEFEQGATFIGFACIKDPARPEVRGAIEDCNTAGIRVIMITGDAIETATTIAKEVGILGPTADHWTNAVQGSDFEAMNHEQRMDAVKNMNVFARVEPKHKRDLVKCLIEHGEIVAMTGDGVNDAPALKQAHIGVAMGITGTEVARGSSDMIL